MAKNYNTGKPIGDGVSGDPSVGGLMAVDPFGMFKENSLGHAGAFLGDRLFGDSSSLGNFINEMTGVNAQQREFEQQEYLLDKQNEWNSAQEQMKRAKEAGINPLTAAGAIAGNGNGGSAPSVASANGAAAGGMSAITGAVDSIGSLGARNKLAAAEAENQSSQANKTNAEVPFVPLLAHGQNMKYFGDFVQSMKDVGIAEIQSGGIAFDMMSGGLQKALDYLSLCSGLRNVDKQMKLIENEYQLGLKDLESYDVRLNSNLSLQEKQGLKAAADAAKAKLEGTYLQQKIDLEKSLPGITLLQGGNLATHLAWKYGVDSSEFNAFENGIYNYAYQSQLGGFNADKETAWERFKNQVEGSDYGKLTHAKSLADIENYKALFGVLADLYFGNSSLDGLASKIVGLVAEQLKLPIEQVDAMFRDAYSPH